MDLRVVIDPRVDVNGSASSVHAVDDVVKDASGYCWDRGIGDGAKEGRRQKVWALLVRVSYSPKPCQWP